MIRAHEAQDQGYKMYRRNPTTGFPRFESPGQFFFLPANRLIIQSDHNFLGAELSRCI